VNRNVSLKSRSNSHLRGAIGASDWCSKEPPAALLISRRGQNVPGRPGARLPGRNNDGLSTSATVRHCSLLRHDRGGIEGTNWATEGRSHRIRELDAPPCVEHQFQSPHFSGRNRLRGIENGEFAGNRWTRRPGEDRNQQCMKRRCSLPKKEIPMSQRFYRTVQDCTARSGLSPISILSKDAIAIAMRGCSDREETGDYSAFN